MFLIWGWRTLLEVLERGLFHCPTCGVDAGYRHVRPRRWFTFFFIPLIPLDLGAPFVECLVCKTGFVEGALRRPTTQLFEYQVGLASRAALAHLLAASQERGPGTADVAVRALGRSPGVSPTYAADALAADVAAFAAPATVGAYIRPLAEFMTLDGREQFLRRAMAFAGQLHAMGSRPLHDVLAAYGDLLLISRVHVAGIAATVEQASPSDQGGVER